MDLISPLLSQSLRTKNTSSKIITKDKNLQLVLLQSYEDSLQEGYSATMQSEIPMPTSVDHTAANPNSTSSEASQPQNYPIP